jgi:hypothetical protein
VSDTRVRQWFVFFLLALLPAGDAVHPCLDVDTWWHLAVGRYIAEHRALPTTDPFSRIGQEEHIPWVAYSWLYELLFYTCYQQGGMPAVFFLKHLLGTLSFITVAWFILRSRTIWLALGVLALVTLSLVPFMSERPWHVTIVGTTLTLHAVYQIRSGLSWKRYCWLPLVFAIWANVHIQFVLGLGILGMGFGVALYEHYWLREPQAVSRIKAFLILGVTCTMATLVTPFHYRLYIVVWEYATQTEVLKLVMELQPPPIANWYNWPLVILSVAAAGMIVRRGYRLWDLAVLGSGLFFALRMQRDLWYGVLTCAAVILRPEPVEERSNSEGEVASVTPLSLRGIIAGTVLAIVVVRVMLALAFPSKSIAACHAETYPVGSVEFVKENHLPGPLFNNFDWGGYFIWNLPELPVSMDGRTNLYGEARLLRSNATWDAQPGWEDDPDLKIARVVIAPKPIKDNPFKLTEELEKSDQWKKVYEEKTAIVFVCVKQR